MLEFVALFIQSLNLYFVHGSVNLSENCGGLFPCLERIMKLNRIHFFFNTHMQKLRTSSLSSYDVIVQ